MTPWIERTLLTLITAASVHFGGEGIRAPSVTGEECGKILMRMALACQAPGVSEDEVR